MDTAWPHAPVHALSAAGTYFVTASTLQKEKLFRSEERLAVLQRGLLRVAQEFDWHLEAWAVFPNHYHFVGHSPAGSTDAKSLVPMLGKLHGQTGNWINRLDNAPGRQVWFNYWETRLTYEKSYYARLNYVHQNAVKHGLVEKAALYPWCSANWFEQNSDLATVKKIYSFGISRVQVADDYDVMP